jgi:autotransporter-associated beta strand protein
MNRTRHRGRVAVLLAALRAATFAHLHAADGVWSATPADGAWENTANWNEGTVPGTTGTTDNPDTATFSSASTTLHVLPDAGRNVKDIVFDTAAAGPYVIGETDGNALLLSDGGTVRATSSAGSAQRVDAPLRLQGERGNHRFASDSANSARVLNFGGAVSGASTEGNTTTLTLDGGNTGANMLAGAVADGTSGGTLAIAKKGVGTWQLAGANSYSGGTTLDAGTLRLHNAMAIGTGLLTIHGGTLMNASGAGVSLSTANSQLWSGDFSFAGKATQSDPKVSWNLSLGTGPVTLSGDRTVTVTGYSSVNGWQWTTATLSVDGAISDGGHGYSLAKDGHAQLALNGTNTFSGGFTLNAGTVVVGNASAFGTGPISVNGGTIRNNASVTLKYNNPWIWNGSFGVSYPMNAVMNIGTGGVTLTGDITVTFGADAWGTVWVVPSVIGENGGSRTLTVTSGGSNPGGLHLTAANTYSGGTVMYGATIRLGHPRCLGTGPFTIHGGGLSQPTGSGPLEGISGQLWAGNFNMSATAGAINLGTAPIRLVGNPVVTLDNGQATLPAIISGEGAGLTLRGTQWSGTFTLSGANTFDGGLTIIAANSTFTINLNHPSAPGTGPLTLAPGGTAALRFNNASAAEFAFANNNAQNWNTSFTYVGTRSLDMGTGTVTLGTNVTVTVSANTLTISGPIVEDGATPRGLRKTGAGTLALAGAGAYAGGTAVAAGVLSAEPGGTLGTGPVSVDPPGRLVLKHGDAIADDAVVTLNRAEDACGKMEIAAGVVERVGSVILDGVVHDAPGTSFGATGSGANVQSDDFFLGTGILRITAPENTMLIVR